MLKLELEFGLIKIILREFWFPIHFLNQKVLSFIIWHVLMRNGHYYINTLNKSRFTLYSRVYQKKVLISCITQWMPKWKRNGWMTSSGKPVINKSELLEMENAIAPLQVSLVSWNSIHFSFLFFTLQWYPQ